LFYLKPVGFSKPCTGVWGSRTDMSSDLNRTEGEVSAPEGGVAQGLRISIRGTKVAKPENWKGVKRILKKKEYTKFTRTPEAAAAYEARAAKDLQRYATIGDEIQVRFFGALEAVNPATGKYEAQAPGLCAEAAQPALVISPNAFPYNLTDDIEHFVLWSREHHDFSTKEVKAIVRSTLGIRKKDFLVYENPDELKSVPNVRHWQVFVKAKALGDHGIREDQPIRISKRDLSDVQAKLKKRQKIGRILIMAGLLGPLYHH